jgi:hypothetical protein
MPVMLPAFFVMAASGSMLFAGFATLAYDNLFFRIKVVGLLVAGINAILFHLLTERRLAQWDEAPVLPLAARAAGLVSIIAWTVVILAGRMISYTMYGVAS